MRTWDWMGWDGEKTVFTCLARIQTSISIRISIANTRIHPTGVQPRSFTKLHALGSPDILIRYTTISNQLCNPPLDYISPRKQNKKKQKRGISKLQLHQRRALRTRDRRGNKYSSSRRSSDTAGMKTYQKGFSAVAPQKCLFFLLHNVDKTPDAASHLRCQSRVIYLSVHPSIQHEKKTIKGREGYRKVVLNE